MFRIDAHPRHRLLCLYRSTGTDSPARTSGRIRPHPNPNVRHAAKTHDASYAAYGPVGADVHLLDSPAIPYRRVQAEETKLYRYAEAGSYASSDGCPKRCCDGREGILRDGCKQRVRTRE